MSIAIPSLRGAIAVPGWAKNELWRRAKAVPSLDLRFAENRSLVDATTGLNLITFSRTSDATFVGSNGLIQTASAGTPRFDHSPITGESLGLLIEEQRTNSIRNNTIQGAVADTPGTLPTNWFVATNVTGLTREIVGIGAEGALSYIDVRLSGTPSGSGSYTIFFDGSTAIAALPAQVWTSSAYYQVAGGTTAGVTGIRQIVIEYGSGGAYLTEGGINHSIGSTRQRLTYTHTVANSSSAFVRPAFNLVLTGASIDITLRIGLPQLEQGAFATSVIPTSGTAVTRAADVCSISGSNWSSWASNNNGTFFSDSLIIATSIQTQGVWQMAGGSNSTSLRQPHATANQFRAVVGGTFSPSPGTGAALSAGATKAAVAYSGATGRLQVAGDGSDVTGNNLDANRLDIGNISSGSYLNGHIRRLVFWRERLANNVLQSITQ